MLALMFKDWLGFRAELQEGIDRLLVRCPHSPYTSMELSTALLQIQTGVIVWHLLGFNVGAGVDQRV